MKLTIIIPVYNEAAHINELLFYLKNNLKQPTNTHILVVDGGSTDNTPQLVKNNFSSDNNITLLNSPKGRGAQMNFGAKHAKGEILYFLHADSYPPPFFDQLIYNEISKKNLAGCFKMKFDHTHWWLRLAGWFTQFNLKFFRGGDQSLFIQKELFNQLGGFPELHPIFEDFSLIRKLYKQNEFVVIQQSITSSSRRYTENGIAKLQYHYWMMYLKKWCGVPTDRLVIYYKKNVR
ncbi:TIGR04283 family arsenosugar biosynthesis glycosyltransferase [Aquimarina agarilytica]|uniref:TIGR04283 family arsenosugar biosynthesis glycosyltransferase n=1 Tax=Aquimarina agarilytica TaxID=1087449 RepID=UPI0002889B89|nr:TIGR04283 family arsenosugar biosynthesis glycosyltransferase [Aquimarina agarilytica]